MVAKVAFEVVSEFVFEEAVALTATNSLTKAVENLSKKTDDAIFGVARLGMAYAKNFLTGGAGFLGFMGAAIKSSEKFRSTQIELANTMLANKFSDESGILDFNRAMGVSETIMKNISKEAKKANLTTMELAGSAKLFANFLAPKGLAGKNMEKAVELARVSVKAGAALNIDQSSVQQQIANAIGGNLSKGTLFGSRLFAESGDVLQGDFGIGGIKEFNKAAKKVRVDALIAGLNKLAGGMDIIKARSQSLTQRMFRLRDSILGVDSILKPLGDTLTKIIGPILDMVIRQVETKGALIVTLLNSTFKRAGETPKELILNIKQLADLHGDITSAGKALRFLSVSIIILGAAAQFGAIRGFTTGLIKMRGAIGAITLRFAKFSRFFQGLLGRGLLTRFALLIPSFGALIFIFQVLSRAANKMSFQFFKLVDVFGGRFIGQIDRLMTIVGLISEPFTLAVESVSDLIGSSFLLQPAFEIALSFFK